MLTLGQPGRAAHPCSGWFARAGCVSCEPGRIDSVETILERVRSLVKDGGVSPERVTLNPDCGFAPGMGATVDPDEVYTKLRNQGRAARLLREEFGK